MNILVLSAIFIFLSNRESSTFVYGHAIQSNDSLSKNERGLRCISEQCLVVLSRGENIVWPNTCQTSVTRAVCGVTITFTDMMDMVGIQFHEILDGDSHFGTLMNQVPEFISMMSYNIISSQPSYGMYTWIYYCANGQDECDKKFVEGNLERLIKSVDGGSIRSQLKSLLYRSTFDNRKQCYISSTALTDCPRGLCRYDVDENAPDSSNLYPPMKYSCGVDAVEDPDLEVTYHSFKALAGSNEYDGEITSFSCNVDKCNGPTNVANVKAIFKGESVIGSSPTKLAIKHIFIICSILLSMSFSI